MTRDEVRAAARQVTQWHERFAGLFGRKEPQKHSLIYGKGLMSNPERKSVEPIALQFARGPDGAAATQNEVVALQGFLTVSPWEASDVFPEIQAVFAEELVPTTGQWSLGTVGVFDESGFEKAGTESVGVARQWCGRLGKTENCQAGVFLTGVTPGDVAGLDAQLFLTEDWAADRQRRKKPRVPKEIKFQTKPQIAVEMLRRTRAAGKVPFDWIVVDSRYGDSGEFLDALEAMPQRYLTEVKKNTLVWTVDPATLPGKAPGPQKRRHSRPGPPIWLVIRRSWDGQEAWYYVSHAEAETPWETLAMVSGTRFRVEEFFQDGKTHLGMADYEARAWRSWHHHLALASLAHRFVTLTKRDIKRDVPDLTLDMAMRVLRAAFARPTLSDDEAIDLIDYYRARNDAAHESHRKTWPAKHKRLAAKLLL